MNTTKKWILGIFLGLVVVAILVGVGLLVYTRWGWGGWALGTRAISPWNGGRLFPWRFMPMRPYGGFPGSPFSGFFFWGRLAGGLIGLAFLVLIVLAAIALVLALTRRQPAQVASTPSAPSRDSGIASVPSAVPAPGRTCPNCSRPVQEDWSHCPYCGAPLATQ